VEKLHIATTTCVKLFGQKKERKKENRSTIDLRHWRNMPKSHTLFLSFSLSYQSSLPEVKDLLKTFKKAWNWVLVFRVRKI
jgi:hypothetical protein